MSAVTFPCEPNASAALVAALVRADAGRARAILRSGFVPDATMLAPQSHYAAKLGVLTDMLRAGLSGHRVSDMVSDVWMSCAVFDAPEMVPSLFQAGFHWSEHTAHFMRSFAATRGGPWAKALREVDALGFGADVRPFVLRRKVLSGRLSGQGQATLARGGEYGALYYGALRQTFK